MRDQDWYNKKDQWQKTVDKYLAVLHTAMSAKEVSIVLGVEEKTARINLKKMEKEGYIWSYILNDRGKIGYIRRLPWNEL